MKKRNRATKNDLPGTIVRYDVGDGITVHRRTTIAGIDARKPQEVARFVSALKELYGSEESPARNSVEWSIGGWLEWSKNKLKAAGLPDETRKDGKRINLEALVIAKGYKENSSLEWYAARILEDNDVIAANVGNGAAAFTALHLGFLIRELEDKLKHEKSALIGKRKRAVQSDLARKRQEKYRAANETNKRAWQSAANAAWAKNLALSPFAVAKIIKKKLNLDVTADWIRKNIRKPTA